jgi:adenylate cyclase
MLAVMSEHGNMMCRSDRGGAVHELDSSPVFSILIEFPSVVDAVACAVAIQDDMAAQNAGVPDNKRIVFRIGINIGDIFVKEGDIRGDEVNIAARLEEIAQPGTICLSNAARDQVRDKLDIAFEDTGEYSCGAVI